MARLNLLTQPVSPIPLATHLRAIAQLRWDIFKNGFRRKGGTGELVARIVLIPFLAAVAIGPIIGSGFAAYYLTSAHHPEYLTGLLWALFILWQVVSINLSPAALSFDPNSLIRFPIGFRRWVLIRLTFGLLAPSTVIGTLSLAAATLGIGLAQPSLIPWAILTLALFTLTNLFFTRMVFAWVDRWLSTRRAREIFTGLILFFSLGIQYLNVTFNPGFSGNSLNSAKKFAGLIRLFHHIEPATNLLPPGLAATSINSAAASHYGIAIAALLGLGIFTAIFLGIFSWRMNKEFHGENLSEGTAPPTPSGLASPAAPASDWSIPGLSATVSATMQKEVLYLRRSGPMLYGLLTPVFMVFIFSTRASMIGRTGTFLFPMALAYGLLGIAPIFYNALGADATGFQFYLLAPIRMRDVILGKNLVNFSVLLVETLLIASIITFTSPHKPPVSLVTATLAWATASILVSAAIGNLRSLNSPKKVTLGKMNNQASQLSALISLGIILASAALGAGTILLCNYLQHPWLATPIFLFLAAAAATLYLATLKRVDTLTLTNRELLAAELCKA